MEMTFYDHSGKPIAYSEDGILIFLFSGHAVGFIHNDSIYDYSGKHLGWMMDGWIIEHTGRRVYFTEEATGGPKKPYRSPKPIKNPKQGTPKKGVRKERTTKPDLSMVWSALNGEQFFEWYRTN